MRGYATQDLYSSSPLATGYGNDGGGGGHGNKWPCGGGGGAGSPAGNVTGDTVGGAGGMGLDLSSYVGTRGRYGSDPQLRMDFENVNTHT